MNSLSPILWTKNLNETISFYETVLGFKGERNFPDFVSLTSGHVEIMFIVPQPEPEECDAEDQGVFFPKPGLTGSIFIRTDRVDELWKSIQGKTLIKTPLANRSYFMRDFSILDNNGYELVFGQPIDCTRAG